MENIKKAAQEYLDRQSRKSHPSGSFDNGGRWYPSQEEKKDCCEGLRSPSRSYKWSYMTHCRTAKHVANLFSVDVKAMKKMATELKINQ